MRPRPSPNASQIQPLGGGLDRAHKADERGENENTVVEPEGDELIDLALPETAHPGDVHEHSERCEPERQP